MEELLTTLRAQTCNLWCIQCAMNEWISFMNTNLNVLKLRLEMETLQYFWNLVFSLVYFPRFRNIVLFLIQGMAGDFPCYLFLKFDRVPS